MACIICFLYSYFSSKYFLYNLNYAFTLSLCARVFLDFVCFSSSKFFNTQSSFGRERVWFIKSERHFHILFKIRSRYWTFKEFFLNFEIWNFHLIREDLQKFTQKYFHTKARILCMD